VSLHSCVLNNCKTSFARNGSYTSNHFHLLVKADDGLTWRCPFNVKSSDQSEVWIKVCDPLVDHPVLELLESHDTAACLDFIRAPLFDRTTMVQFPKNRDGDDNDAQDRLEHYAERAKNEDDATIFVFGEAWEDRAFDPDNALGTSRGVHDIHMNQGNSARYAESDGIWQDGGVIFKFAEGYVGVFCAFNSQVWATDDAGHRLVGFGEGPRAALPGFVAPEAAPAAPPAGPAPAGSSSSSGSGSSSGSVATPASRNTTVKIISALVNPTNAVEQGHETVTIFNGTNADIDLTGWRLVDYIDRVETLSGTIAANRAETIVLDGTHVMLANSGGALRLVSPSGHVVDAVVWSRASAGEIVVF
jgi:uncharacterized protein YukJ